MWDELLGEALGPSLTTRMPLLTSCSARSFLQRGLSDSLQELKQASSTREGCRL